MQSNDTQAGEIAALQRLLAAQERTIAEQAEAIRDYRWRLDAAGEHARQLIAMLTDQRRLPWWRRWFR